MNNYKSQYDKLTEAYINLKVNPFKNCNCFVGNLLNNSSDWASCRDYEKVIAKYKPEDCITHNIKIDGYTIVEIVSLEMIFLKTYIRKNDGENNFIKDKRDFLLYLSHYPDHYKGKTYEKAMSIQENALFKAFEVTLNTLREIHINKGETNIDEQFIPSFTKRQLQTI